MPGKRTRPGWRPFHERDGPVAETGEHMVLIVNQCIYLDSYCFLTRPTSGRRSPWDGIVRRQDASFCTSLGRKGPGVGGRVTQWGSFAYFGRVKMKTPEGLLDHR
jgi:hypothetical protein